MRTTFSSPIEIIKVWSVFRKRLFAKVRSCVTNKYSQKYDSALWWTLDNRCNLDCAYCIATRTDPQSRPIDIDLALKTLGNTGRRFRIHFSSVGEPFLTPNMVETAEAFTQEHFVSFNTNLTSKSIRKFVEKVRPDRVVHIVASLHIKELEKRNLVDRYIENYRLLHDSGFPVRAQVVAYPALENEIEKYRQLFGRRGIEFRCNYFNGTYEGRKYPESYTDEEIKVFGSNIRVWKNWNSQFGEPCNAGHNIAVVSPHGVVTQCYDVQTKIGHIYHEIRFMPQMQKCPSQSCICPMNHMDLPLFKKAFSSLASELV